MNRAPLIPIVAVLGFTTFSAADDADKKRIRELERKIAELEKRLEKADEKAAATVITGPSGLTDAEGRINPGISNAVVIIEGDESVGTGFIGSVDGKKYIYTAAHVFSGNSRLTVRNAAGTGFKKFGDLEAAEGADLVRMEILDEVMDALDFRPEEPPLQINTKIAALGNGGGNGVIAVEQGLVLGTSVDTLEVDAGIIQGNSGGPVVEVMTGRVVGLVTHLSTAKKDMWTEGTRQGAVRRFACRLNREWAWKPLKIGAFLADGKAINDYKLLTNLGMEIAYSSQNASGTGAIDQPSYRNGATYSAISENREHELVKSLTAIRMERADKTGPSDSADSKRKIRSLLSQTLSYMSRSQANLKPQNYSWYHRNMVGPAVERRDRCIQSINRLLEAWK